MRAREKEARHGGRGGDYDRRDRSRRLVFLTTHTRHFIFISIHLAVIVVNVVVRQLAEIDVEATLDHVRRIHVLPYDDGKLIVGDDHT